MSKTYRKERDDSFIDNNFVDALKVPKAKIVNKTIKIVEHFNLGSDLSKHLIDCLVSRDTQFDEIFTLKFDTLFNKKRIPTGHVET